MPDSNQDLFDHAQNQSPTSTAAPLAHRLRPQSLEDFFGQDQILGQGHPLYQWIQMDTVPSMIFWGPPGCGKTTLAQIIAKQTQKHFVSLSAVFSGVKDIEAKIGEARDQQKFYQKRTILFIDEIHRFNKAQQDALLPHVENGTVTLIGATTENPSFEVNAPLLSRMHVIRFESLADESLKHILKRAAQNLEHEWQLRIEMQENALAILVREADGDARRALTSLENFLTLLKNQQATTQGGKQKHPPTLQATEKALKEALKNGLTGQAVRYDKHGEEHYNVISALIKSIRDSDPDAGLYYLARVLEAGEDPLFIARRLVILASEDVGNAAPQALTLAINTKEAVHFVGMPEARINLAQAVTYLALAPKSNAAYAGINQALQTVKETGTLEVPYHLRNAVTGLMKQQGYGKGYQYAHHDEKGIVNQSDLPEAIQDHQFYQPKAIGYEKQLKERLEEIQKKKKEQKSQEND